MQFSVRAVYAVRALIYLAAAEGALVPADQLAAEQAIPGKSLEAVMTELRRSGIVRTQRGPDGGFSLAKPAAEISLAEIVGVLSAIIVRTEAQA
jgi:Rrf2 family protein